MKFFNICLLSLACFSCQSQPAVSSMEESTKNIIVGEQLSLSHFFETLDSLSLDSCKTISIVHIGDSHIQADYFSGMLRVLLQQKFGNAGRGLIFPYKIAHTNEPVSYSSSSLIEWKGVRNVINPNHVDIGVSGIAAFSAVGNAGFTIKTKNQKEMNYAFNRVELFSNTANCENTRLLSHGQMFVAEEKKEPFISAFQLQDTTNQIDFRFSAFQPIDIHGMVLKNDQPGIIYHSIGVNGATFKSYNSTSLFMEQLRYLKPDLIIISLGTNESYANKFNIAEFAGELDVFMQALKKSCTTGSVLFTTPADNYKIKKGRPVHNNNPQLIGNFLKEYAIQQHYALWDLYGAMGGKESMKQWKQQGLATKDYVHFTRKGYELQGNLLFEALMHRYKLLR